MGFTSRELYSQFRQAIDVPPIGSAVRWIRFHRAPKIQEVVLDKARVKININSISENQLTSTIDDSKFLINEFLRRLKPSDCVWYTNRGIGVGACLLGDYLESGEVVVFEPNPKRRERLEDIASLNNIQNIHIVPYELASLPLKKEETVDPQITLLPDKETCYLPFENNSGEHSLPTAIEITYGDSWLSNISKYISLDSDILSMVLVHVPTEDRDKILKICQEYRKNGYESYIINQDELTTIFGTPVESYIRP